MLAAQTRAEALRIVRSPFFLIFSIGMPLAFYFLFAALNGSDTVIESTVYGAYSLMSMTAFSLVGTAVSQFGIRLAYERRDGWVRTLRLTPLSPSAWVGSKIAAHLVMHLAILLLLFASGGLVYDLNLSIGVWISSGLWLWIGSVPFLALGALLGTMRHADAAIAVGNVLHLGMSVLGGLWMPLSVMPKWMQMVGQWLPTHRYAHGAWNLLAGSPPSAADWMILAGFGAVCMLLSVYILNRREAI
ncbi:ABC transporter permease [Paenibacillus thermoaerophilus]|nr:ABC transporter permease [Paenibacillus thermoaerophilus]